MASAKFVTVYVSDDEQYESTSLRDVECYEAASALRDLMEANGELDGPRNAILAMAVNSDEAIRRIQELSAIRDDFGALCGRESFEKAVR